MAEPAAAPKFPRWLWLLVLVPFLEVLLPRAIAIWALPVTAGVAIFGLVLVASRLFPRK